jgi:hypothetical protein
MPRARLPTELKQLGGTYRRDRANPKEPKPPKQEPPMPRHLSVIGKKEWRQACDLLSGMGVLTQAEADRFLEAGHSRRNFIRESAEVLIGDARWIVRFSTGAAGEPRRVCRRLHCLRRWSHDEEDLQSIFT